MEKQKNQYELPKCLICDKVYASMSSFCHHNQKFHPKNKPIKVIQNIHENPKKNGQPLENTINMFFCVHCDKSYKYKQGLSKHKKKL